MTQLLTLIGGVGIGSAILVYGLLMTAHRPFQDWKYKQEYGVIDRSSESYKTAISTMTITGSRAAGGGFFLIMITLAVHGFFG